MLKIKRICENGIIGCELTSETDGVLPSEVFLYRAEDDSYQGVTSLPGLAKDWPAFKTAGKCFYRSDIVAKTFSNIEENESFITSTINYMRALKVDYMKYIEDYLYNEIENVEI
jgi:hypothetical protein